MDTASLLPVILSGGSGTRLWPASRGHCPKQFLPLVGGRTLIQETLARLQGLQGLAAPLVICNQSHRFLVAEQLREMGCEPGAILLEPLGRNTAPAVALAALHACRDGADPLLLVLAADHVIEDGEAFHQAVEAAARTAEQGALVTFGICPHLPETGYGYIRARGQTDASGSLAVEAFVEKPDRARAESYLESGDYFWNSGMFLFRASRYLAELERWQPEILNCCRAALQQEYTDLDFVRLNEAAFAACPSDSIDYAVMENTRDARMVPLDAGWNDVGSWSALWDIGTKDGDGNVLKGDVLTADVCNSYLQSSGRLLGAVGVDNLVVVETPDAVMVAHKERVQEVKQLVDQLKSAERVEAWEQKRIYRPWGYYEAVDVGERFQVKHIRVRPGGRLSLQKHHHRAEHWVVVSGTARVTRGEESFLVSENQSTYIPLGEIHRLENPGRIPLDLIEVQTGSYLGEDDIERLEDSYGRA